ncbi:MAG: AsnC family transcriptional regulator [Ramlibacter sp.]
MNLAALDACLARERRRAAAAFVLDEELGTHHGLSWEDYVLLDALQAVPGGLPLPQLAARLGVRSSRLLLRIRPMEKLGLVARGPAAGRPVALCPGGRRLLHEARETAAAVCAGFGAAGQPA